MSLKTTLLGWILVVASSACSSLPKRPPQKEGPIQVLPGNVFFSEPTRSYQVLGTARSWHEFKTSLDETFDDQEFSRRCYQAFFKASEKVLAIARANGGEAVAQIRSVVFLADGRKEYYPRPECVDDGEEGEALVEGQVIRWSSSKTKKPSSN